MATPADLRDVRRWVGTNPDDTTLTALLDEPLTVAATALAVLGARRADMLAAPAILDVDGDMSRSYVTNLTQLDQQIADLEKIVAGETAGTGVGSVVASVGQFGRCTPGR